MIEIFSRKPAGIDLAEGQHVVPIKLDENSASLSASLLNDDYYSLVREQHNEEKNLPFANPAALIPLKARVPRPGGARCEGRANKERGRR
jgi:hypothetical protein